MFIQKVKLKNFRNYDTLELDFTKNLNVLYGDNAQGKTNFLEAIYYGAFTRSYRADNVLDLIKLNEDFFKLELEIKDKDDTKKIEIVTTKKGKKIQVNKVDIKRISDYIGNLNVVLFAPEDNFLIKGTPASRRTFLDMEIGQVSKQYINVLSEYNHLLKQRNEYLKTMFINSFADKEYLDVLTERIIEKSIFIYSARVDYIKKINEKIGNLYKNITGIDNLVIKYSPSIDFEEFTEEEIKEKMLERFDHLLDREMSQGNTLIGPHRDDFSFLIDEKNLKIFGSQGQQRLAILCFKLAELDYIKEKTGYYPIILFDDVFSELDNIHKNKLLQHINKDVQTFITTTNGENINKEFVTDVDFFVVENSKIEKQK